MDNRVTPQTILDAQQSAQLRVPSYASSMSANYLEGVTGSTQLSLNINNALREQPQENKLEDAITSMNLAMQTPNMGFTQKTFNFLANIAGTLTDPGALLTGGVGLFGARAVASGVSKVAPEAFSIFAKKPINEALGVEASKLQGKARSVGEVGRSLGEAFGAGAGVSVPFSFNENYNPETNKFDIAGGIEATAAGGGLGLLLSATPMAIGTIIGKLKKSYKSYENIEVPLPGEPLHEDIKTTEGLQTALRKAVEEKNLTQEDAELLFTYLSNPDDVEKIKKLSSKILIDNGHDVDVFNNKYYLNIMKPEDFQNFQKSVADQLASNTSGDLKNALSYYVQLNNIDRIVLEQSKALEGLKGVHKTLSKRLMTSPERLASFDRIRKKFPLKHITEDHPLSQKNLYGLLKKHNFDAQKIGVVIPKNLQKLAKQESKISVLKKNIVKYKKDPDKYLEKISQSEEKIKKLQTGIHVISSVKDELEGLEKFFMSGKRLPKNYQISNEYHRLLNIADFSEKSQALLHHIQLKDAHETQEGYKNALGGIIELLQSNTSRFANHEKLYEYIKTRYEKSINEFKGLPIEEGSLQLERQAERIKSDIVNDKAVLEDAEADVRSSGSKENEDENIEATERYTQLRDNPSAIMNLVSCQIGGISVKDQ